MITLPLIITIVGLLIYAFLNKKVAEIGRLMFFAGLLTLLLK